MEAKNGKYFKKLIILCLLLGIIPVIAQGIFFYKKTSDIIQQKVNELNMQILHQTQMRVEQVLDNIHSYYMVLANAYADQYIGFSLNLEEYDKIIDIQNRLINFQYSNSYIRSAYLVNIKEDWIIGNDGFGVFSDMGNKDLFLDILSDSENCSWIFIKNPSNTFKHMNVTKEFPLDSIFLLIKLPLNSSNPTQAIVVNISSNSLSRMISKTRDTGKTFILDENNKVVASSNSQMIGEDISKLPYVSKIEEQESLFGFFQSNVDGVEVGVSYRKSQYNNWKYITIYSVSEITSDSRYIGLVSVVICIVLMSLIVVFSLLGSMKMYNPIRDVYDIVKKSINAENNLMEDVVRDEFAYISEGVNTLINSQTLMQEEIKNQLLQLEEFFLFQLLNGELSEYEIQIKLKNFDRVIRWNFMYVATLQIELPENSNYKDNEQDILMISIHDIVKKSIPLKFRLQPILKKTGLVILIGAHGENQDKLKKLINNYIDIIQQKVYQELGIAIKVGISSPFNKFTDAYMAYKESLEALICQVRNDDEGILFFEDAHLGERINKPYPQRIENGLVEAINLGDLNNAQNLLEEFIDEIFHSDRSINDIHVCLSRLMINIIKVLQDSGESIDCLQQSISILYEELYKLKNLDEIKDWFKDCLLEPIVILLEQRRSNQNKVILENIIQMIHEEYDTDITLETCAQKLNYHPSHIWRILRTEMNTTFSEYLSQYRLKVAKEWLRETDMTVAEIAERLQYSNSQNFIRFFKKMEGATPGQYRKVYHYFK